MLDNTKLVMNPPLVSTVHHDRWRDIYWENVFIKRLLKMKILYEELLLNCCEMLFSVAGFCSSQFVVISLIFSNITNR